MVTQMRLDPYSKVEGQDSNDCEGRHISQAGTPLSHSLKPDGAPFCSSATWRIMAHVLRLSPPSRQGCRT